MSDLRNQLEQALGGRIVDPIPETKPVDLGADDIPIVNRDETDDEDLDPVIDALTRAVTTPPVTGLNWGQQGDADLSAWLNNMGRGI